MQPAGREPTPGVADGLALFVDSCRQQPRPARFDRAGDVIGGLRLRARDRRAARRLRGSPRTPPPRERMVNEPPAVVVTDQPPDGHRAVPLLAERDLGHYPEFRKFLAETFDLYSDPFGPPGCCRSATGCISSSSSAVPGARSRRAWRSTRCFRASSRSTRTPSIATSGRSCNGSRTAPGPHGLLMSSRPPVGSTGFQQQ